MSTNEFFKDNFIADFGYSMPKRTKKECANPEFIDKHLHRVAIMKDEHWGAPGDRDEGGIPGWTTKLVCNGCDREFKHRGFYPDSRRYDVNKS